eukprot:3858477-Ditylum_brightwellii.AAC.1
MNAPGDGCQPDELISEAERATSNDVGISTPTSEKGTSIIDDNTASSLPSVEDIVCTLTSEEKMEHGWTLDGEQVENGSNLQLT